MALSPAHTTSHSGILALTRLLVNRFPNKLAPNVPSTKKSIFFPFNSFVIVSLAPFIILTRLFESFNYFSNIIQFSIGSC